VKQNDFYDWVDMWQVGQQTNKKFLFKLDFLDVNAPPKYIVIPSHQTCLSFDAEEK
jgi:hypothetical protein